MSAKPENERERIAQRLRKWSDDCEDAKTWGGPTMYPPFPLTRAEIIALALPPLPQQGQATWADDCADVIPCPICGGNDDDEQLRCEACGGAGMLGSIEPPASQTLAEPVDVEAIKREAYKQGWNDRESDLMVAVDHIYPDGPAEAQARVERSCTCHPDDKPPEPCAKRYALSECLEAERQSALEAERDEARQIARVFTEHWPFGERADRDEALRYALCAVPSPAALLSGSLPKPARVEG